jgi:hypothetical protein
MRGHCAEFLPSACGRERSTALMWDEACVDWIGRERSYRLATLLAVSDRAYLGSLEHYRARSIAPNVRKSSLSIAGFF